MAVFAVNSRIRSWARVVGRLFIAMAAGQMQAAVSDMAELGTVTVTREEIIARPRLADGSSPPNPGCSHPHLVARGNASTRWFSCRCCSARWPRREFERLGG